MSSFFGLQIAYSALAAQRQMLETAAHNMANVSTPGYTRQRVEIGPAQPYPAPGMQNRAGAYQVGSGVRAVSVDRVVDQFLDTQLRVEIGKLAEKEQWEYAISQVEGIFNEPGEEGVAAWMAAFWNSWEKLSVNPSETAARVELIHQASGMIDSFKRVHDGMVSIQENLDFGITSSADALNNIADRLVALNKSIASAVVAGYKPNDLIDSRERLITELQEYSGVRVYYEDNGMVSVHIGGGILVQEEIANYVEAVPRPGTAFHDLAWVKTGSLLEIQSGKLHSQAEMRDTYIPQMMNQMDNLVSTITTAVNAQHVVGYDYYGNLGLDFFTGTTFSTIQLNPAIYADASLVAAAELPNAPGDGENARLIANLKEARLMSGGLYTSEDYYRGVVARLGVDVRAAQDDAKNSRVLTRMTEQWRESVSGVSIDEEMIRIQEAQRAFQAAARVVTAMDEILVAIINMGSGR